MRTGGSEITSPPRPVCHFTPVAGWLNDPNGLVFHDGLWHLCFQHHPYQPLWGPMHWGHAVSRDLVRWEHRPVALAPDALGTIFSGSGVVDEDGVAGYGRGVLAAFFTYHRDQDRGQALAVSADGGRTWTKHPDNPILLPPASTPDFRDPRVLRYVAPDGRAWWVMVVAAGQELRFYGSDDLLRWTLLSTFATPAMDGPGVFETPELFELPIDDGPERAWVLSFGHTSGGHRGGWGARYLIGMFDGERFRPFDSADVRCTDHGPDLYAAQCWTGGPDGRRIWVGWMSNWAYADRIPATTWRGTMSIPRQLGLARDREGAIRLVQQPVAELSRYAQPLLDLQEPDRGELGQALSTARGASLDVRLSVRFADDEDAAATLLIHSGAASPVRVSYLATDGRVVLDRRGREPARGWDGPHRFRSPARGRQATTDLRVLIDTDSVEVFADGGTTVLTSLLDPRDAVTGLGLELTRAEVCSLTVARIGPSPEHLSG